MNLMGYLVGSQLDECLNVGIASFFIGLYLFASGEYAANMKQLDTTPQEVYFFYIL